MIFRVGYGGFVSQDEGDEKGGFSTFSGYLCNLAGEIPAVSDHIVVHNYIFTITEVGNTTSDWCDSSW